MEYTKNAIVVFLYNFSTRDRKISCPQVSQICNFNILFSILKFTEERSNPIVAEYSLLYTLLQR